MLIIRILQLCVKLKTSYKIVTSSPFANRLLQCRSPSKYQLNKHKILHQSSANQRGGEEISEQSKEMVASVANLLLEYLMAKGVVPADSNRSSPQRTDQPSVWPVSYVKKGTQRHPVKVES